jgi:hypothetical protein
MYKSTARFVDFWNRSNRFTERIIAGGNRAESAQYDDATDKLEALIADIVGERVEQTLKERSSRHKKREAKREAKLALPPKVAPPRTRKKSKPVARPFGRIGAGIAPPFMLSDQKG